MSSSYARPMWAFFVFLGLLVLTACAPATAPVTTPPAATPPVASTSAATTATPASVQYPLTIKDRTGRDTVIAAAPKRVVTLSPGATEIAFAIGAGDVVIGTDSFSDFPAQVAGLPKVAYSNPSLEQITALTPDLVIAATRQKALVPEMERLGLKVFYREEPDTVAGVLEDVRTFGQVLNRPAQAEQVAADTQGRIDRLTESLRSVTQGPTVFYEVDPKLFTASDKSFVGNQLVLLKARNIAAGSERPFPQLSQEAVITAAPEVILLTDAPPTGSETAATVAARPGWAGLPAVRNGRVYPIDGNLATRPGPRVAEALELLAGLLYPDRAR